MLDLIDKTMLIQVEHGGSVAVGREGGLWDLEWGGVGRKWKVVGTGYGLFCMPDPIDKTIGRTWKLDNGKWGEVESWG